MRIEIPEGMRSCPMTCPLLIMSQAGVARIECVFHFDTEKGELKHTPGPSCPGPGVYELVPVADAESHQVALKTAIEQAYQEGARSREAEVERLRSLLLECVGELGIYIKYQYGWPEVHPAQRSKYDAEMELVDEARKAAKGEK